MSLSRRLVVLVACVAPLFAASPLQEKVRAWRVAHERELIDEYRELLAIPNIPVDRANIRRNADFIVAALKRRGIEARLLTAAEQRAVAAIPSVEDALKRELGLARVGPPAADAVHGLVGFAPGTHGLFSVTLVARKRGLVHQGRHGGRRIEWIGSLAGHGLSQSRRADRDQECRHKPAEHDNLHDILA